uniref:Uncharacterized protein n=1 Tax=Anguilla anguilla TaxID=7936 RepID=A0A0E9QMN0_ANGAN
MTLPFHIFDPVHLYNAPVIYTCITYTCVQV